VAISAVGNSPKAIKLFLYLPSLLGQDGWILVSFLASLWTPALFWSIITQKRNLANILTSRLVNNPYVLSCFPSTDT